MGDLRFALRSFARVPGFTIVAVLTLALGIGATTAMFSVVNAVLLQPLPFDSADRLVVVRGSLPDLRDVATRSTSFDATGIWATNLYTVESAGESRQLRGAVLSKEVLPVLGVTPVLGRTFTAEDDRSDTVILGYGLWQSMFGGDPNVLGRTLQLTGTAYTVIGVAPPWFRFPSSEYVIWTPLGGSEAKVPAQSKNRALRIFNMVARLSPAATAAQAQSELNSISENLSREYPQTNAEIRMQATSLYDRMVGDVRDPLILLLGAVAMLLLIACANVANLLLARTTVREREIAIRSALGASRVRIARQLAVENLLLAGAGGALGLIIGMWGVDLMPAALEARLPRADGIRIDGAVLLFAFAATVLTSLLFGVAPAMHALSRRRGALQDQSRSQSAGPRGRHLRRLIVAAEVALAVIVVIGAGLMARSFAALTSRDPGFDPAHLLTFNVQLVKEPDDTARRLALDAVVQRIATIPGVEAVGGSSGFPVVTAQRGTRFNAESRVLTGENDSAYFMAATPDYFRALGVRLSAGRQFAATDTAAAPPVVIVNRQLASSVFGSDDPIGRRIKLLNPEQSDAWRTIVGVVDDLYYQGAASESAPAIYTPFDQTPFLWSYMMVRTTGDPASVAAAVRTAVPAAAPRTSAANLRTMTDILSESVAEPRLTATLSSLFGALALILAAVGIYGVISYSVAQRTREIGIRRALGAEVFHVIRLVIAEGLLVAAVGVAVGVPTAALLMRSTSALLFGVTTMDQLTYAGAAGVILVIALLASWVPARRAIRVGPAAALRAD